MQQFSLSANIEEGQDKNERKKNDQKVTKSVFCHCLDPGQFDMPFSSSEIQTVMSSFFPFFDVCFNFFHNSYYTRK